MTEKRQEQTLCRDRNVSYFNRGVSYLSVLLAKMHQAVHLRYVIFIYKNEFQF